MNLPKRIIIAATPRTGSTLLQRSLETHPQCISSGEWYTETIKDPNCNLLKLFGHNYKQKEFRSLLKSGIVIFLHRLDRQAQISSWERACSTGYWGDTSDPYNPEFQDFTDNADQVIELSHSIFSKHAHLSIPYETLITYWYTIIPIILSLANWTPYEIHPATKSTQEYQSTPPFQEILNGHAVSS